jgi:tRNA threonylcarbamoyladenosine biosynthesis protein TsaB
MRWLAIETSTARGSVALGDDETLLGEEIFVAKRGHNAAIFEPLKRLMGKAEAGLDGIVVGTGPGSYGGVRVGIAVATGLSLAQKVPVIGVPSLLGPSLVPGEEYVVVGDARRGSFFVAEVGEPRPLAEPELLGEEDFVRRVDALGSEGRVVVTFDERPLPEGAGEILSDHPSAAALGRATARMSEGARGEFAGADLQPIYLRAPYITEPKG